MQFQFPIQAATMYILVALFTLVLLQFMYIRLWKYRSLKNVPSLSSCPVGSSGNIDEMFDKMVSLNKNMGSAVFVWNTPITPKLFVANCDLAHAILSSSNTHLGKTKLYDYLKPFLGSGLATSTVSVWKKERKLTNPAFNLKLMEAYDNIFEYHGNELVDILKQEVNKKSIDLVPFVDLYALDVICESIANVRTNLQRKADHEYLTARSRFLTIVMNRMLSFLKGHNAFFKLTGDYKIQKQCAKILNNFSQYLIRENNRSELKDTLSSEKFKNVLDILLESELERDRVIDHLNTFIVAGHDTPASTIAFALYEIAQHPEIQQKIIEESVQILGKDKDVTITKNDMQTMVYLEAVIKEVLRYYPGVAFIERKTEQEVVVGETIIPSDVEVTINIYGLHHNEDYFENANEFIPERFLTGNELRMNSTAFMPFSKGPRDCIGKTFAMFQMKSVISKVLRNFALLPTNPKHKVALTSEFVMKSTTGLRIQLQERNL